MPGQHSVSRSHLSAFCDPVSTGTPDPWLWIGSTKEQSVRPNDGFDVTHLVPAMCIGGLIAVDTDWKDIGGVAAAELPGGHVGLYRPGELDSLALALEASR